MANVENPAWTRGASEDSSERNVSEANISHAKAQLFDYDSLPRADAALLKEAAAYVRAANGSIFRTILQAGNQLLVARELLPRGAFGHWLEAEFSASVRAARYYLRAAEVFGAKTATVAESALKPTDIYMLAAKSTPSVIIEGVVARIERGEPIDMRSVRNEVKTARDQARRTAARDVKKSGGVEEQAERERGAAAARALIDELGIDVVRRVAAAMDDICKSQAIRDLLSARPAPASAPAVSSTAGSALAAAKDRTCQQCRGHDGTEQLCALPDETVWLHRECQRFYLDGDREYLRRAGGGGRP